MVITAAGNTWEAMFEETFTRGVLSMLRIEYPL